jgi:hypothetical protein
LIFGAVTEEWTPTGHPFYCRLDDVAGRRERNQFGPLLRPDIKNHQLRHSRDRIYGTHRVVESNDGLVSWIGPDAIQPAKTAELHVCHLRSDAAL